MDLIPLEPSIDWRGRLLARRHFLKSVAAAGAALPVIAGPFGRLVDASADGASDDHFVPLDKRLDPRWLAALREKGSPTLYRGEQRAACAMPCGGIGVGQLYVGGDGTLRTWSIFNQHHFSGYGEKNYEFTVPPRVIEHGFAIVLQGDAAGANGKAASRVRRLREEDVPDVEMTGEHPVAEFHYPSSARTERADVAGSASDDGAFPIEARLQVFAPFIPLNAEDSTLPVTIFRVTLTNRDQKPRKLSLVSWLENATAPVHGDAFRGVRTNRIASEDFGNWLECRIDPPPSEGERKIAPPEVFADFEGNDYGAWKVEGAAFGTGPARGTQPDQQPVTGFEGSGLVNTYRPDDRATGTLTSPPFPIRRPYLNFKIGGGEHPEETCLNLLIDGKVVASATGHNRETLEWAFFDVSAHAGEQGVLQIVDRHTGAWGHINVDQIEFGDVPKLGSGGTLESQSDFGQLGWISFERATRWIDGAGVLEGLGEPMKGMFAELRRPLGALAHDNLELAPGASRTLEFALLWYFPNHDHGRWYASRFGSARELALYVAKNRERLIGETLKWRDAYYVGSLPHWLLERLHAPLANVATDTAQVWKNGRFWAWEGVGCCEGTCTHVWNYEHGLARLFPALARSTREMQDLGEAFHEDGLVGFRGNDAYAADGQVGTVLKCYREHLTSADDSFLTRNWPRIKRVMEYSLKRDADDDGLLEDNQHNTYDVEFFGANTFVGSLYLAALRAAEEMAKLMGDAGFAARCRKVFESGRELTLKRLWNGEYFVQQVDLKQHPKYQYADGCLADQLFGQGWARQVGLGDLYPDDKVKQALASVWRYNWAPDVGPQTARHQPDRYFARRGEAGLFVCTWPKSKHLGRDSVPYRDEVWTGIEYQVAGHMLWEGMVDEALATIRAVQDRYDGRVHNPWNEIECGDHYARSLASWGCYLALLGFEYDGPKGVIGFAPRVGAESFQAAFTVARGWGTFRQQRAHGCQDHVLAIESGELRLNEVGVELEAALDGAHADVWLEQREGRQVVTHRLDAHSSRAGSRATARLDAPLLLHAGERLRILWSA